METTRTVPSFSPTCHGPDTQTTPLFRPKPSSSPSLSRSEPIIQKRSRTRPVTEFGSARPSSLSLMSGSVRIMKTGTLWLFWFCGPNPRYLITCLLGFQPLDLCRPDRTLRMSEEMILHQADLLPSKVPEPVLVLFCSKTLISYPDVLEPLVKIFLQGPRGTYGPF